MTGWEVFENQEEDNKKKIVQSIACDKARMISFEPSDETLLVM